MAHSDALAGPSVETQPLLRSSSASGTAQAALERDSTTSSRASCSDEPNAREYRSIAFALSAAMLAFLVNGMVIASLGVMVPCMQQDYDLSDIQVSAIFLAGPAGYCLSALTSDYIHSRFGRRAIAAMGPLCILIFAVAAAAAREQFQVLILATALGGFGGGLLDVSLCAWTGAMEYANTRSGLLHGAFSVGAAIGPFLAGALVSSNHTPWYTWYYVLAGAAGLAGVVLFPVFRKDTGAKYREAQRAHGSYVETESTGSALAYPSTWLFALFMLADNGGESTMSNWVVSFMIRIRGATPLLSSICSSGFWGGMAVGRLVLGVVTDRLGAPLAVSIYLLLALAVSGIFAVVQNHYLSVGLSMVLGFFFGPLFPSCIVQVIQSLPAGLHVPAVSFVASIGQVGVALLPYGLGAITHTFGLVAFQYMMMAQVASALLIWLVSLKVSASQLKRPKFVRMTLHHVNENS